MLSRYWKIFIFITYTWIILYSPVIIGLPAIILSPDLEQLEMDGSVITNTTTVLQFILFLFVSPVCVGILFLTLLAQTIYILDFNILFFLIEILVMAIIGCFLVYFVPLHMWWTKQTIPRAAQLAIASSVAGVGAPFFWQFLLVGRNFSAMLILPSVILFYGLLYIGNKWQKKRYPNCKIANKIRYILKWPCLRT